MFKSLAGWIKSDIRRIAVLTDIVYALLNSRSISGGDLAAHIFRDVNDPSIMQMLRRFYKNEYVTWETFYVPLVQELLKTLPHRLKYVLIDTTDVGSKHRMITISLAYKGRSFPLIWHVEPGVKGRSKDEIQLELLVKLKEHISLKGCVIFLGDSEFSSVLVLKYVKEELNWYFTCRVKPSHLFVENDETEGGDETKQPLSSLVPKAGCKPETRLNVGYTAKHRFKANIYACWEKGHKEPLVLVYHLPPAFLPRPHYQPRFWIETLFGDCKEGGLRLNNTRLEHPERIARLFLTCAIAYIWMIVLGANVIKAGLSKYVDRSHRRTLSVFKIGWRWFKRQLKLDKLVEFTLQFPAELHLPIISYNQDELPEPINLDKCHKISKKLRPTSLTQTKNPHQLLFLLVFFCCFTFLFSITFSFLSVFSFETFVFL